MTTHPQEKMCLHWYHHRDVAECFSHFFYSHKLHRFFSTKSALILYQVCLFLTYIPEKQVKESEVNQTLPKNSFHSDKKNDTVVRHYLNIFPQTSGSGIGAHFFHFSTQNANQVRKKTYEKVVTELRFLTQLYPSRTLYTVLISTSTRSSQHTPMRWWSHQRVQTSPSQPLKTTLTTSWNRSQQWGRARGMKQSIRMLLLPITAHRWSASS